MVVRNLVRAALLLRVDSVAVIVPDIVEGHNKVTSNSTGSLQPLLRMRPGEGHAAGSSQSKNEPTWYSVLCVADPLRSL